MRAAGGRGVLASGTFRYFLVEGSFRNSIVGPGRASALRRARNLPRDLPAARPGGGQMLCMHAKHLGSPGGHNSPPWTPPGAPWKSILGRFHELGLIFWFARGPAWRTLAPLPGAHAPLYILPDDLRGGSFGGRRPKASFWTRRDSPRPRWRYLPCFLRKSPEEHLGP